MKKKPDETSEGLNQIFAIINAKGDTSELKEIVERDEDEWGENEPTNS